MNAETDLALLLEMYDTWLQRKFYQPRQYANERERVPPMRGVIEPVAHDVQDHLRWLVWSTALLLREQKIDWAVALHRLGQIQAALWVWGHFSIEELREHCGDGPLAPFAPPRLAGV